jgi:hypothetical protein
MAVTGDPTYSAAKAGYAHPQPRGSDAMARPQVQAEIVRLQTERLFSEILPLAVQEHKALLTNALTPAGAKVQAIKLAYDQTFGRDAAAAGKDPSEMNGDELASAIDRLYQERANRAKPVVQLEESSPKTGAFD